MKVLIIGGVAGGASAAARLRRLNEYAEITIIERSGYISYANCGLPYYIGDVISESDKLTLQTPESFWNRFRVEVRVRQEACAIDRTHRTVRIRNLETGEEYEQPYDKLILAPGAKAVIPDIPGIDSEKVFVLKTVEDTFALRKRVDAIIDGCKDAAGRFLVIGGGFIGLETAENLRYRGFDVTIIQHGDHVLPSLDTDMARLLERELIDNGIDVHLKTEVKRIEDTADGIKAVLSDGQTVEAAGILCTIGVAPESDLAKDAGLALGVRDAIKVDDTMRTSDPHIYAVGDAVEVTSFESGNAAVIPLAGPANKQGRIAADSICGITRAFHGSQGSSVIKVFDLTASSTGLNEKHARAAAIDFDSVILTPPAHAAYYPGATTITMKVLFEPDTGRIIGAQAIGKAGVEKRIDVIATAIRAQMVANDLTELDLSYAPPYSSAKDPVNMAGFMIQNLIERRVKQVSWDEALKQQARRQEGDKQMPVLLDTRTDAEYERGHLEGALHIPVDDLRERLDELDPATPLNVYCQSGLRSYIACRLLMQKGFDCANVSGGYGFYSATQIDGAGPCGVATR